MGAIIPVFIPHAGCPHDCVFCNQKKIAGTLTPPDSAEVSAIIESALKKTPRGAELAFYGGSFTAIPKKQMTAYLDAARPYLQRGDISSIRLSTRPDAINEDVLNVLKTYGVTTIELGVQSMDEEVLKKSGRGHSAEDAIRAAELVKGHGFFLVLQMMTHLPGTSREKDIYTARKLSEQNPDAVRIYPTVVVANTALETMWRRGEYTPATIEQAAELGAQILEIFDTKKIPVIRFGLNPSDDLSGGEALAGAYHPALGEMARSAVFLKKIRQKIKERSISGKTLDIYVPRGKKSICIGQKRANIKALISEFGFSTVSVYEHDGVEEIRVSEGISCS